MQSTRRQRGFTLIELIVAVAVVGILASLAYPAYTSYLVRGRRAAAQATLADIGTRQQQYLMDNRAYASTPGDLRVTVPADVQAFYTIQISVGASLPPSFTATAAPLAGTSQAADGALTLTSDGTRLPAGKW